MTEPIKDTISVAPAINKMCGHEIGRNPAGGRITCPKRATVEIGGVPLCDQHAEYRMMSACGRDVQIKRGPTKC